MEETEIAKAIDLKMTAIVLEAMIPTHAGDPRAPIPEDFCCGGVRDRKVTFIVDTTTWECQGQLNSNDPVLTDEAWWVDQCRRVSDRVRAQIKSTTA